MVTTDIGFDYVAPEHYPLLKSALEREGEDSCETSFVNLLIWQKVYGFKTALIDGVVLIRGQGRRGPVYRLPVCDDFERGMHLLRSVSGVERPELWAAEGERLERFLALQKGGYSLVEDGGGADYIYSREQLVSLSGKKYQAKRNHISAFSRAYDWRYEPLCADNKRQFYACAQSWYEENADRADRYMAAEREGVMMLLDNFERLPLEAGAVFVDGRAVAFSIGSAINRTTFDVHIEKALGQYSAAYSVINREFARSMPDGVELINREDDLGHEGLRRAKLSYHPVRMIKKYYLKPL